MRTMRWDVSFDQLFDFRRSDHIAPAAFDTENLAHLVDTIQSGDIVLMHDNAPTAERIDAFLTQLEQRGFGFVLPGERCTAGGVES